MALHPNFAENRLVYLSFAEPGQNGTASTALGRLEGNQLTGFEIIFSQEPKLSGPNHFGGASFFRRRANFSSPSASAFSSRPDGAAAAQAQTHLLRTGFDKVIGYLRGGMRTWTEAGREFETSGRMSVYDLNKEVEAGNAGQLLDVRREDEWQAGFIPGAQHVFLPFLGDHLGGSGSTQTAKLRDGHSKL